ncbi:MAG TPA: alpha/beta hydrolase-fold protein [Gaiellaceae bacterium]|nr:alpha/beta hydrolase-fold protein [Gaiellaceae bacterium]
MAVRARTRPAGPRVDAHGVDFAFPDPRPGLASVRLAPVLPRAVASTEFERRGRTWRLRFPRPPVDRFEYQLALEHRDGGSELIADPANPLVAPGPFGDKSVVEFPEYRSPAWLESDPPTGETAELAIPSRPFRRNVSVTVWSSPGAEPGRPLPLLVVHDGPETATYTALLHFLANAVASNALPPMRAALVAPFDRDETYSASAAYARTLAWDVLPGLAEAAPTPHRRRMRIGMGASLGALAMLHAHRRHPDAFGGLFLQSGSYFRARTDRHESRFPRFERVSRFVGRVLRDADEVDPIDVTITCGTAEENLANNRAVARALREQGYEVRFHENRDAHTWIGWRDTYDPHLLELLARKWG